MIIISKDFTTSSEVSEKTEDFCTKFKNFLLLKDESDENLIKQISRECSINSYEIIHYLLSKCNEDKEVLKEIKDYYHSIKIDEHSCLVIADTHIGRLKDGENNKDRILSNEYTLNKAYEFAYKNGIKNIIHAGDLIEGDSNKKQLRLRIFEQLDYLKRIYPQSDSAHTFFILGNHDYNAKLFAVDYLESDYRKAHSIPPFVSSEIDEAYRSIKNFEIIGISQSYLSLPDSLIKISHPSSSFYKTINLDSSCNLKMSGHSHKFLIEKDDSVSIPCLACTNQYDYEIGFLLLIEEEKDFVIKRYNKEAKQTEEKVVKKKFIRQ